MKSTHRTAVCFATLMLFLGSLRAQRHHDPFNQLEIDQIRDAAQEPDIRLKLYVKFSRLRLDAVENARSNPKVTDKAQETRDRLQDFVDVYDELNENVDTYGDRHNDIRKSLRVIIEADNEFQAKLRALKDAANVPTEAAKTYEFLLADALEALDSSAKDHRDLLTEQEELAKQKKLIKPDAPVSK